MKDLQTIARPVSRQNQTETERTNRCIRVVVADDSPHIRKLMGFIFKNVTGYIVRFAEDGEDAWSSLCAEPFDLLITDIDMPRLDGIELVRRMREHSLKQPVIFISGSLPDDASGLFEQLSPCDGLEKPFSFAEMLTKTMAITHHSAPTRTNGDSHDGTNGNSHNGMNAGSSNGTNGNSY